MPLDTHTLHAALDLPRDHVYTAVTGIGTWWPHRRRPESQVALEPWVGGQFFETWVDGGVLHGTVAAIRDGRGLSIAVPPSVEGPAFLGWSVALDDVAGGRTTVALSYRAYTADGPADAARHAHTAYWRAVLDALGRHLRGPENVTPLRRPNGV